MPREMSDTNELTAGTIRFQQACHPTLTPSEYSIRVEQRVAEIRPDEPFTNDLDFFVSAPRFTLNPDDVYSVYPPVDQSGAFGGTLPHIVFTRRTIPWERTVDGKAADTENPCPWFALLAFSASDFKDIKLPGLQTRAIQKLLDPDESDCMGPAITLAPYESPQDKCNTLDLPLDLFVGLAPKKDELPYLAHVREVHTGNKETLSFLTDGVFSSMVANRFPEEDAENLLCLVSLEGYQCLIEQSQTRSGQAKEFVRLAVLAHWTFNCQKSDEKNYFKALVDKLDASTPFRRPLPKADRETASLAEVTTAFSSGFTALNHHMRNGEKSFSWYRGPLVPVMYSKRPNYSFTPSADAALRYNYKTGLLDVSYAAAWQLGRMLALQNSHFSLSLYRYRNQSRMKAKATFRNEPTSEALEQQAIEALNPSYSAKGHVENSAPTAEDIENQLKAQKEAWAIPEDIKQWLGRALLLYGVPFNYLVPDEAMLPAESIRFFSLDPAWMKCLLEGACSVGRNSHVDTILDQYLRDHFLTIAGTTASEVRESGRATAKGVETSASENEALNSELDCPLTGFLLRSLMVEGWQGLEMTASGLDANGNAIGALKPLRIDRLGPEVMICIFEGKVTHMEIAQPPEGLHFGAAQNEMNTYSKSKLRKLLPREQAGVQIDKRGLDIPMRSASHRVIDITSLTETMKTFLQENKAIGERFTSVEFAMQMIESPARAIFLSS